MGRPSKLTTVEKYTIQGALNDKKTIEEICDLINRPLNIVKKYVEGELSAIHETIAKVNIPKETKTVKAKDLFAHTNKSGTKENGVTIMTQAASEKSDSAVERNKKLANRHISGNVYRLSDQKILKSGDNIKEN